jgi:hypothetical protein
MAQKIQKLYLLVLTDGNERTYITTATTSRSDARKVKWTDERIVELPLTAQQQKLLASTLSL